MITAKVVCDSISPDGIRLTTLHLRYPRMVHADFMTHRVFSRNGRSSRAVPFATLVKETPYTPDFCYNQKGMVAGEPLVGEELEQANYLWNSAATFCQTTAEQLSKIGGTGVHKQWVNRMLEWFGYIDVLVTSTDWANFFALRDEEGAQPEIIALAKAMKVAIADSSPKLLQPGEWHLPYIEANDYNLVYQYMTEMAGEVVSESEVLHEVKKVSVARCARLTIKPFDGNASIEAELKRYDLLMVSRPVHASPAEHIATPDTLIEAHEGPYGEWRLSRWAMQHEHGNYNGWRQFRKMIPYNTVYD